MGSVLQARVGISEAILVGLGALDGVESHAVEVAQRYLPLLQNSRAQFGSLNLEEISERQLLHLISSMYQVQDLALDLRNSLGQMLESGRAEITGQQSLVQSCLQQLEDELNWIDDKTETLSLALDPEFVNEMNRRISAVPTTPVKTPEWKRELAGLCD